MLRLKHVGLLLHIFAIFHVNAQYYQPRSFSPWSPVPRPVYQVKHVDPTKNFYHVFGDQFEIPLSHLKNIYLAGYDTEIYQLKKDVENESVTSEIKVTFYLWTHHGFKFIGKLNTDLQTLKRNINKYHHYFQLKKVYIERYTKKQWRIDKLIMLPSKFSDDMVLKKYQGNGNKDLVAVVEEPTVMTLPEPCEEEKQDKIQAPQPKAEVKQSDVLIDIYKELTDTKDKINNNKEDVKGTNDVTICESDTATYNTYDNSEKATTNFITEPLKPIIIKPEKSENKYQTTVTPGILTEYDSQICQTSQKDTSAQFGPKTQAGNIQPVNRKLKYDGNSISTLMPGVLTEYDAKFYQNNQEPVNIYIKTQTDNVKYSNYGLLLNSPGVLTSIKTPGLFSNRNDFFATIQKNLPQIRIQSQTEYDTYTSSGNTMFWPRGAAEYSQIYKNNQGSSIYFNPNTQTGDTRYENYGLENLTPNVFSENQKTRDNTKAQINYVTCATPNSLILSPGFNQYQFTNQKQSTDGKNGKVTNINFNDAKYFKNYNNKSVLRAKSNTQMNYMIHPRPGTDVFRKDNIQYNTVDQKPQDNVTPIEILFKHLNKIGYDNMKSEESKKYNQYYTSTQTEENIMRTTQTHTSPGFVTNRVGFGQYGTTEKINNDKIPIELKETQSANVEQYDIGFDYDKASVNTESGTKFYQNKYLTGTDKHNFEPAIDTITPSSSQYYVDQTGNDIDSTAKYYHSQAPKLNVNIQTYTSNNFEKTPQNQSGQDNIDQKQKQDVTVFADIPTQMNTIVCNKHINKDFASQFPENQMTLDKTKPRTNYVTYTTLNSKMLSLGSNQYYILQNNGKTTAGDMTKQDIIGYDNVNSGVNTEFGTELIINKENPKVYTNYVSRTSLASKMLRPMSRQYFSKYQFKNKDENPYESVETELHDTEYANNDLKNIEPEVNYDFKAPGVGSKFNIWDQCIKDTSKPHTNFITFTAPSINNNSQYHSESPMQKTNDIHAKAIQEPNYGDDTKVIKSGLKNNFYVQEQSDKENIKPCMNYFTYSGPSTAVFERGRPNEDKILEQPFDANLYSNLDFKIVSSQTNYLTHIHPDKACQNKAENPQSQYMVTEYNNQLNQGQMAKTNYRINENTAQIQLNNDGLSKQEPVKYSESDRLYYQTYPQPNHNKEKPMQFAQTKFYDDSLVETPSVCKFSHIYPQIGNNHWSAKIKRVKPKPRMYKIGYGNIQQSVPDITPTNSKAQNSFVLNKPVQSDVCKGHPYNFNVKYYPVIKNNKRPNTFESQIKDISLLYTAEKKKSNKKSINPAIYFYSTDKSKYLIGNTNFGPIVPITVSNDKTTGSATNNEIFEKTKTVSFNKIPCYTLPQTYSASEWYQATPTNLPEIKGNLVSYTDSRQIDYTQIDKINNVQNVPGRKFNKYDLINYSSHAQDNNQKPYILSQINKIDNIQNIQNNSPAANRVDYSLSTINKEENTVNPKIHKHEKIKYFNDMEDKKQNMENFPIHTNENNHDSDYTCNTKANSKPVMSSFNIQTKIVKEESQPINERSINYVENPTSSYVAYNPWINLGKRINVDVNKNKVLLSTPNTFYSLQIENSVPSDGLIKENTAKITNYNTNYINLIRPTANSYLNYNKYQPPRNLDFHRQKLITKYESSNDKSLSENPEYSNLDLHSSEAYLKYIPCNKNEKYVTYIKENNPTCKKVLQTDTMKYLESNENTKEFNLLPEYTQLPEKCLNIYDSPINRFISYPKIASENSLANIEPERYISRKISPFRLEESQTLKPSFIQSKYQYHIPATLHKNQPIGASIQSFLPHSFSIPGTLHHFYSHFTRPIKYEPKSTTLKNKYNNIIQPCNTQANDGLYVKSDGDNKETIIQYDTTNLEAIQSAKQPVSTHIPNSLEINNLYNRPSYDSVMPLSITTNAESYDLIQDNVGTNKDIKWDQFKNIATFSPYKPSITTKENDKVFYNTISQNAMPLNSEPCVQYQPSLTRSDQYINSFSESVPIPSSINEKIKICSSAYSTKRKTSSQNSPNAIDVNLSTLTEYSGPFAFTNTNKMSTEHQKLPKVIKSIETAQPVSCSIKNYVSSNLLPSAYPSDVPHSDSKPLISSTPLYFINKVNNYPSDPISPIKKDFPKILKSTTSFNSWYSPVLPYSPDLKQSKSSSYSQPSYLFSKPTPLLSIINPLKICPYQSKPVFNSQLPITEIATTQNENLADLKYSYAGASTYLQSSYCTKAYSSIPTPSNNGNNEAIQLSESNGPPKSSIVVENSNQNDKLPDPFYSYDGASVYPQSFYISPKISSSNNVPCQTLTPMSKTDENSDEKIGLEPLANDIKTSINDWLTRDETSEKLTIPVGQISLARLPDKNKSYILKTDDPNIRIRAWKDKIKIVKVKLVLDTHECSVMNFLPEIVKGNYDPEEVQNIVKNYVKRNYGEPIVIKGSSFYKPYVIVYNSEMFKSGRCFLWPTYNSQLNCWTS